MAGFVERWEYTGPDRLHAPTEQTLVLLPGVRVVKATDAALTLQVPRNLTHSWGDHRPLRLDYAWPNTGAIVPKSSQLDAFYHLLNRRGAYLCLPPGAGKSAPLAAAALTVWQSTGKPTLICTLRSLACNWRAELTKLGFLHDGPDSRWTELRTRPKLEPGATLPDLRKRGLTSAQWVFCHPEIIKAWAPLLIGFFGQVILDEAHLFGNPDAQRTEGAHIAAATGQRAGGYVWAASGTPLTSRVPELLSVLQMLEPGAWGTKHQGRIRWAGAELKEHGWKDTGPTNEVELRARLDYTMFSRTRSQLGFELPRLSHKLIAVDSKLAKTATSRKMLDVDAEKLVEDVLRGRNLSSRTLAYITKLKQQASAEKISTTVELVNSLLDQGVRPIVFVSYRETADALCARLVGQRRRDETVPFGFIKITGADSQTLRDVHLGHYRAFAKQGYNIPLIATYECLGVGVNLQEASAVIHHDLSWVPSTHIQATARAWRQGQTLDVTAYYVFARGTLDEVLARALVSKMDAIGTIDDGVKEAEYQSFAELIRPDDVERWVSYIKLDLED